MDTVIVDTLYVEFKKTIDTKTLNSNSIIELIGNMMVAVERLKDTPGAQKK